MLAVEKGILMHIKLQKSITTENPRPKEINQTALLASRILKYYTIAEYLTHYKTAQNKTEHSSCYEATLANKLTMKQTAHARLNLQL